MKKNIKKRLITFMTTVTLGASILFSNSIVFGRELEKTNPNEVITEINSSIEKNVSVSKDKINLNNKNEIIDNIDDKYIDNLNSLARKQGLDIVYTKEMLVEIYEESINKVNKEIKDGNLEVLEDGSMVKADDESFYLQGGSTFDKTYWWGVSRWKSTYNANQWVYDLNKAGIGNAAYSVLLGAIFGGVGAIPNGLTSAYCLALANEVGYRNGKTTRGIVADINWTLVYSVYGQ